MTDEKQADQQAAQQPARKPPDRTEYQRQYYLSRREELAEAKRLRYQEDAAYRQMILEASAASKRRYQRKRLAIRAALQVARRLASDITRGAILVRSEGPVRVYLLVAMAQAIGVAYDTVRRWRRTGVLPPSPYRLQDGTMVYSQEQILAVSAAYMAHLAQYPSSLRRILYPGHLRTQIEAQWRALGALGKGA